MLNKIKNNYQKLLIDNGLSVQEIEQDIYNNYRARWGSVA